MFSSFRLIFPLLLWAIILKGNDRSNIFLTHLDKKNGLSSNYIHKVVKDQHGFIWIATNDGLCKYETHDRIKIIRADTSTASNSLYSSNIRTIHADSKHNLWIGTRQGGLTRYHQPSGTWTTFKNDPNKENSISNNDIISILEDRQGRLWIGTENGLNLFNPDTESFIHFLSNDIDNNTLQTKAVISIHEDQQGWIWVGTWAGGLHLMLNSSSKDISDISFRNFRPSTNRSSHHIWSVCQINEYNYLIGSHGAGVLCMTLPQNASNLSSKQAWQPTFSENLLQKEEEKSLVVLDIHQDSFDKIWLGTSNGVYIFDSISNQDSVAVSCPVINQFDYISSSQSYSLKHNTVNDIFQDQDGIIWLSTAGGISVFDPDNNHFNYHSYLNDIDKINSEYSTYVDKEGVFWFLSSTKGIVKYDSYKKEVIPTIPSWFEPTMKMVTINGSTDGSLLIGTDQGIGVMNKQTLSSIFYPFSDQKGIDFNFGKTTYLYRDSSTQRIWGASFDGLFVLEENTKTVHTYTHNPDDSTSISDNAITFLFRDSKGSLWITTYNGLNRINPSASLDNLVFERFHTNALAPSHRTFSNRFITITELKEQLYIGTTDGLCTYDGQQFVSYGDKEHKYWIQSLQITEDENIWGSTTESLFYFNTQTGKFRTYEEGDGLSNTIFDLNGGFFDTNNQIYFTNPEGIVSLNSSKISNFEKSLNVEITGIRSLNEKGEKWIDLYDKNNIELSADTYYLTIDFAALNYSHPHKNRYAYRLKGFEKRWNYTNNSNATFTNLDPGTYHLEIQAASKNGVWANNLEVLTIEQLPSFWQTIWFKLGVLLGLIVLIVLGIWSYTKALSNRNYVLQQYNKDLNLEILNRKKIEQALQDKTNFTEHLMNSIPQYICWIDEKKQLIGANTAFLKLFNIHVDSTILVNQTIDTLAQSYLNDGKYFDTTTISTVLQSKQPILNRVINVNEKSEPVCKKYWFKQDYIPLLCENNSVNSIIISSTDITKNQEAKERLHFSNQQLIQSNKELEQFAFIASHDLRSPLNTIYSFTSLLNKRLKNKLDEKDKELIEFVIQGTTNMQELVDSILEFSIVNNQKLQLTEFSPLKLIEAVVLNMSAEIKNKHAQIKIENLPVSIIADRIKLKQLLQNLITNGIKFVNKGIDPIIIIRCTEQQKHWQFEVKDNGIGIEKEFYEKIFNFFQRLHSNSEYKGTGIGLALCKKIVNQHRGNIWLESEIRQGTSFYFTINKNLVSHSSNFIPSKN